MKSVRLFIGLCCVMIFGCERGSEPKGPSPCEDEENPPFTLYNGSFDVVDLDILENSCDAPFADFDEFTLIHSGDDYVVAGMQATRTGDELSGSTTYHADLAPDFDCQYDQTDSVHAILTGDQEFFVDLQESVLSNVTGTECDDAADSVGGAPPPCAVRYSYCASDPPPES